jgi:hypothetical protein
MRKHALAILVIPLLYLLSAAPAVWLISRGLAPEDVGNAVYWPLVKAYDGSQEAQRALDWYVGPFRK